MTIIPIPLNRIAPDPAQPRIEVADDGLHRLTESIRTRGLLQPIRVRPAGTGGNHVIVFGHRRAAALPLLDLPAAVRERVHAGTVSKDTGYHLARVRDGGERDRLMAQAMAGQLQRDAAARAVRGRRPKASESSAPSRVTCRLGSGRSLTVTAEAITLESLIGALEELLREARKVRPQGLDVTTFVKVLRDRAAKGGAA